MKQYYFLLRHFQLKSFGNKLCLSDCIYNNAGTSACLNFLTQHIRYFGFGNFQDIDLTCFRIYIGYILLYLPAICPGNQRISSTSCPYALLCFRLICPDKLCASFRRKRCRKQYHRNPIPSKPRKCTVKILVHICIIGMNLINNYHLPCKAEMTKHNMSLL